MKKLKLFFLFSLIHFCLNADMPEPYASVTDIPFDPHGWFVNGPQIEAQLKAKSPMTVIEVGSWLGCSTRFIAERLPPNAKLYAVDTWLGSSEHQTLPDAKERLPSLFQQFLSNVKHANLTHIIVPIRMESVEAARSLNVTADFIYIDAAHETQNVINDIVNWYPHLNSDGVMCGDDWGWPTVRKAVRICAKKFRKHVRHDDNFWWYE